MKIPGFLERLNGKPGVEWNPSEALAVKEWLCEPNQLHTVAQYASRYLGSVCLQQDIEDAVVDFYTLFDNVVKSYRPGGPTFWHYLVHVCFRNYCVREGERLRRRIGRESSLDSDDSELRYATKLVDVSVQGSPSRMAQSRAFVEDLTAFLNEDNLPERQRQVFVLRYLEDLPYERIAEEVGSPVGSVKGWLNRATIAARAYLSARGWAEWQIES